MTNFRYLCYREFKNYVGSVSALYELIELAVREFTLSLNAASNSERFINEVAQRHGLYVHFKEAPDILAKTIQLHIVNVHEAFEKFLDAFRKEIVATLGITWQFYEKHSSLYAVLQNVYNSQKSGKESLGPFRVELCEYYRLIRNEIIHSSGSSEQIDFEFAKVKDYAKEAVKSYEKMGHAPNSIRMLTRDDFQLFIRVTQDVAWHLCQKTKPTNEQILKAIESDIRAFKAQWLKRPERVKLAVIALVEKKYGIDKTTANTIATQAL